MKPLLLLLIIGAAHCWIQQPALRPRQPSLGAHCDSATPLVTRVDKTSSLSPSEDWKVERLSEEHVLPIARMCVQEWGPSSGGDFTLFPRQLLPAAWVDTCTYVDNFVLASVIYLGLYQRINRKGGLDEDDYQVFCITCGEDVVGAAELSLQAPHQTASPLCLPVAAKQWIAGSHGDLVPYVSNVIVDQAWRGKGFGKRLVMTVEDKAKSLGHGNVFLHVSTTAAPAKSLYRQLGYMDAPAIDESAGVSDTSIWLDRLVRIIFGLYFVSEQELEYMTKRL